MKKTEPMLQILLSLGLILVLLYLGVILLLMAVNVSKASGMGLCWPPCEEEPPPPAPIEAVHLGRLDVGAHGPGRVAVDPQGRFYVTDPERYRVIVTDAHGQNRSVLDDCGYPSAIAVGPDGKIFLGDALTHAVYVMDPQGGFLHALGKGKDEFSWPTDIAVEPVWGETGEPASGRVYVADAHANRVMVYSSTGAYLFAITGPGADPLGFPNAVGIDPSGLNLVVSDHSDGQLQLFSTDGTWVSSFGSLSRPSGVALDGQGNVYASDSFQSKVYVFDLQGNSLGSVGQYGDAPGDLKVPTDSALDPYGRLVVVSFNNGVLELFGPTGYTNPPADVAPPTVSGLAHPCFVTPAPNLRPVADAGLDRVFVDSDGDGAELVALDGTGSYDPDGAIVSYEWFEGPTGLGGGSTLTVGLPLGTHAVDLVVTDNNGETGVDRVEITVAALVEGTVEFRPDTLKLSSGGSWIKAYIELPGGLAADIDAASVVLNDQVPAERDSSKLGDFDNDGVADLMVLFGRQAVVDIVDPAASEAKLVVTGWIADGSKFRASNIIAVKP